MSWATRSVRDHARKRIAVQVRSGSPCWLCEQPIDLSLRYPNNLSFTVDHVIPTSHGGTNELEQLRPAHAICNKRRGNQPAGTIGQNSGVLEP